MDVSVRAVPKPGVPRHGWYAVSPSLAIAVGQHSTAAMKATRDTERLKVAPPMLDFGGLRASHHMTYSISTFTIEIDGTATAVLQAKWHSEADEICQGWTQYHWEQLLTKGRHGLEFPPIVKVRLARADERAAYNEGATVEFYEDVKIVYLVDLGALHHGPDA